MMKFFFALIFWAGTMQSYACPDNIKTVLCHPVDDCSAEPVVELGGGRQLLFSFDDLSPEVNNYSYKIIHCDPDWNPSRLSAFYYMDGFAVQPLTDYDFSHNTAIPYTHYRLLIPNEEMKIKLSGNYLLQIVKDDNPDSVVVAQPFSIVENRVTISGQLKNPANTAYINTSQELTFSVSYDGMVIHNPVRDVKVYVTQNQDVNSRRDFSPTFVRPNRLVYGDGVNNLFDGLAPFRNFQSYSMVYFTQYVRQIVKDADDVYHVVLQPGKRYETYLPLPDRNGGFTIKAENVGRPELEAEYVMVHFAVYAPQEIPDAEVYIYGKFSGWQFSPARRMSYDADHRAYVGQVLLKQGDYDYMYAVLPEGANRPDLTILQGNYYLHRNSYTIRCYLYDYPSGYYRFVGYTTIWG